MYGIYDAIKDKAIALGACGRLGADMDGADLYALLHTPQGREFCVSRDFPKAKDIEHISTGELTAHGVFRNHAAVVENVHDMVFIGRDTDATAICTGTDALHHIVALDEAHVTVRASCYAVVSVDMSATARVEIINDDKTSRVTCHRKEH